MKKTTLSFILITFFTAYAIFQRMSGSSSPSLVPISISGSEQSSNQGNQIPVNNNPAPTTIPTPTPRPKPTPTPTSGSTPPKPTPTPVKPTPTPTPKPKGQYVDGSYTGSPADAYYGNIQVKVTISGGRITDVVFLDYPQDRGTSREINSQAMPYLKQEAIAAQSANVNIVSGATDSSLAFRQSMASALAQAKS